MTQLEAAAAGKITPASREAALKEGLGPETVRAGVAEGAIVIPRNRLREKRVLPVGIGGGLRTKVSASVGPAGAGVSADRELAKARTALAAGADLIMELGTAGDIDGTRRALLDSLEAPVGTLPVYQAAAEAVARRGAAVKMNEDDLFEVIVRQASEGADLMVIHAALTRSSMETGRRHRRRQASVSYGGTMLMAWMLYHDRENPLYAQFDRVLETAREYDVTIALGDTFRPGCPADSLDAAQIQEMLLQGELAERCRRAGVQVLIKGPGTVPLHQIEHTVLLAKQTAGGAPVFMFGPFATGLASGREHIAAAIGGAAAARAGAGILCSVPPGADPSRADAEAIRQGVVAARIAAHAGDIARGLPGTRERDLAMSKARKDLDWERQFALALDAERARSVREAHNPGGAETCSMCGRYCAMQVVGEYLGKGKGVC